jgi:hypothetical protein
LSNFSFSRKFGEKKNSETILFGGKFFFNWAMFSSPKHAILTGTLRHIVELVKREYLGESAIKMGPRQRIIIIIEMFTIHIYKLT